MSLIFITHMTVEVFNESFVGISELKFQRISDNTVLSLPTPSNFVITENKQQKIQRTKSTQGRTVRAGSYITGEEPTLQISYSYMQPEVIAFRLGNQFQQGTYDISLARTLVLHKSIYDGAEVGYVGAGMPADQLGSSASIRKAGGLSLPLTRQPFVTFDPATVLSFAQGVDGAMKFSNDLVQASEVISLILPYTVTGLALGDSLVGSHRIIAHLVNTENYVWVFVADNVTPNVEGAGLDPSAEMIELPFFVNNQPGACRGWNLYFTNEKVKCSY